MLDGKDLDRVVLGMAEAVAARTTRRAGLFGLIGRSAAAATAAIAVGSFAGKALAQFDPCSDTYECGSCDGDPCESDGSFCVYDAYCDSRLKYCTHSVCPRRYLCSTFTGQICNCGCGGCDYTSCGGCC